LAVLALAAGCGAALAQQGPYSPAPAANPVCVRLEGQLAMINRGGDPSRAEQIRRYEDSVNKQQFDLDRLLAQARRLGCDNGGFFSIFSSQPPQCGPLNSQIQDMRGNVARMQAELQRMQGGGELESQRQNVIAALAQNNCGPQYQAAANQQRGFFGGLFGGWSAPSSDALSGSTYRTLCVRTCDGYYFPISFSATPAKFPEDEQTCQRMCPAAEVALYTHRNPGEDVAQAVSTSGRAYRDLPTAFSYRKEFNPSCSCRRPGQSWADALGATRDTTVERGDIVVTEERAKALSQPRADAQGKPLRLDAKPEAGAAPPAAPGESGEADPGKRSVRTVGPTFVPTR
jgi:hypothetical protein